MDVNKNNRNIYTQHKTIMNNRKQLKRIKYKVIYKIGT